MGFFSRNEPQEQGIPVLSQERLTQLFDQKKWHYYIDNEGDLGGNWDENQFFFLLRGKDSEILHIQGRWHNTVPLEKLEIVREFINRWHRDKLWPKCYHRINDDGRISVFTEVPIDHEHGATDEQLYQQVSCAIGTSAQFFTALADELDM